MRRNISTYGITAKILGQAYLQHTRYLANLKAITIMLNGKVPLRLERYVKEQCLEKAILSYK